MTEAVKCNPQKVLMTVFSTLWRKSVYRETDEKSQHRQEPTEKGES